MQLNDATLAEGTDFKLEVMVRGFPAPHFKWFRNHQELEPDECIQMGMEMFGKKKYKIFCVVSDISFAERGEYDVEVTNSFGSVKSNCMINVLSEFK